MQRKLWTAHISNFKFEHKVSSLLFYNNEPKVSLKPKMVDQISSMTAVFLFFKQLIFLSKPTVPAFNWTQHRLLGALVVTKLSDRS